MFLILSVLLATFSAFVALGFGAFYQLSCPSFCCIVSVDPFFLASGAFVTFAALAACLLLKIPSSMVLFALWHNTSAGTPKSAHAFALRRPNIPFTPAAPGCLSFPPGSTSSLIDWLCS